MLTKKTRNISILETKELDINDIHIHTELCAEIRGMTNVFCQNEASEWKPSGEFPTILHKIKKKLAGVVFVLVTLVMLSLYSARYSVHVLWKHCAYRVITSDCKTTFGIVLVKRLQIFCFWIRLGVNVMMPGVCLNFIANIWYFLCILCSSLKFVFLCEHKDGKKNKYTPEEFAKVHRFWKEVHKGRQKVPIICNKIVPFWDTYRPS